MLEFVFSKGMKEESLEFVVFLRSTVVDTNLTKIIAPITSLNFLLGKELKAHAAPFNPAQLSLQQQ